MPMVPRSFSFWRIFIATLRGFFLTLKRMWLKIRSITLPRSIVLFALLVIVSSVIGIIVWVGWLYTSLPDVRELSQRIRNQTVRYYDRTGKVLLYESFAEERRALVTLDNISEYIREATIAVEDKNFYEHQGISIPRLIKAMWVNITSGERAQGGSTLTMQLVKNAILTRDKEYTRKVKELMLAWKIENSYSKDQILEMYLNESAYGGNVYGVEAASQTFFGKSAKSVSIGEAAILASVLQAPSFFSPYGSNKDKLLERQKLVIRLMEEQGRITSEEAETARNEEIKFIPRREKVTAPHFVFLVRDELERRLGKVRLAKGGLSVTTTLDAVLQKEVEQAISDQKKQNQRKGANNAAAVVIDIETGDIRALVGSSDYWNEEIHGAVNVTVRPRQPGSSIKPLIYGMGFAAGLRPETILYDVDTTFVNVDQKPYHPQNYDGSFRGPVNLRTALALSLNIPAVKVLYLTGFENVLNGLRAFQYSTIDSNSRYGLSVALGGIEVTPLEHTNAYAALAREGVWQPYRMINSVIDQSTKQEIAISDEPLSNTNQKIVLDKEATQLLSDVMSDNDARSSVFGVSNFLTLPDRPVAAKTGTTNRFVDAWTMGYTPQTAVGVWVGNSDGTPMSKGADGSQVAAPIWQKIMIAASRGSEVKRFSTPPPALVDIKPVLLGLSSGHEKVTVDSVTGQSIPSECISQYPSDYISSALVPRPRTILSEVTPGDIRGPIPQNPEKDPNFVAWDSAIRAWARKNNQDTVALSEITSCDWRKSLPDVQLRINSPLPEESISGLIFQPLLVLEGDTVSRITIRLDDLVVYSGLDLTPTITLPQGLNDGIKKLVFEVITSSKQRIVAEQKVLLSAQPDPLTKFSWSLLQNLEWKSSEPIEMQFSIQDPSLVRSVDCYARQENQERFMGSVLVRSSSLNLIGQRLTPGEWKLQCRINGNNAEQIISPTIMILVK